MTMKKSHRIQIPRPILPTLPQPEEPEDDTYYDDDTLSLPEFRFIEFAGLDGFDPQSCCWRTPVDCDDFDCSSKFEETHSDCFPHFNINNNKKNKNPSAIKKTVSGPCNFEGRLKGNRNHVHLPKIPGAKAVAYGKCGQRGRGRVVYDDQALSSGRTSNHNGNVSEEDEESLQRKLDRIRIFGATRSYNTREYRENRQSSLTLPPLHGALRRSTSLPCHKDTEQSKGRKAYMNLHKKSIRMYRDYHQNVNLNDRTKVPWQGPNSKANYCSNPYAVKSKHSEMSSSDFARHQGGRYGLASVVNNNNNTFYNPNNSSNYNRKESSFFPNAVKSSKHHRNGMSSSTSSFSITDKILFPPCKPSPFLRANKTKNGRHLKS